ncbi:hypothetical protein ASG35_12840 [Burkholderia sp. Leaf177]|uniref:DUF4865 family protein n=1 Tax=Burkholderia sp. Leaf177 TaxID=1736287 RepID=UPI0006F6E9B1|nr:DUF4865 family protein [Burkholderia sp. Leaf177]KQR77140.1 hypothetical protein ASG35_12840 [Burkholderia sp. Leaf177]
MIIKQYQISLPADYRMQVIRDRVASRGASFDTFAGLGLKCFLIREKGKFGAMANEYSPVYLWPQTGSMWDFLAGPAFEAIKESFGVPLVNAWPGLVFAQSENSTDPTTIASVTREEECLLPDTNLTELRHREATIAAERVNATKGLFARAVGLDPRGWRLVRFDYWTQPQADLSSELLSYEVLHVSAPAFDDLMAPARD